jgi:hypothetical protein
MSLTYDITKVADRETIHNSLIQQIVFMTISVGIGVITEKNYIEFYRRTKIVETIYGPAPNRGYLTLDDIKRVVGLKTNVFPETSAKKFLSNMQASALEKLIRDREIKNKES